MMESKTNFKNVSFIGIALCAACCALPIVGVTLGVGTLTVLSHYIEWVGMAVLLIALVFFVVYATRKRKAPSCDKDCDCKSNNTVSTNANVK